MPSPEIRRLTVADLPVAKELRLAALLDAPNAFMSTYADSVARSEEQWVSWIEAVAVFGAFLDGRPAGMVGAIRPEEGLTELISMWVSPDARGHRLAGRLAEAVVGFARESGDRAVHLEVIAGNDAAESAYLKSGFRHIPKRKDGQRDRSMWLDV
ncbi:N-acetyltransferase [Actinorhabdospora filicis]|uniref:N-acetyltransferase n=1 Tax=Actinorhabdospora filicis TaxID=1785913 RepID=A0A9W6SNA7_9ACTN|nr:GNAT family N-acetyltransferase [Actinorhabdospora filicis]GLZ77711.1 N-acetyltransferase [Actinorhabdospora filicis]